MKAGRAFLFLLFLCSVPVFAATSVTVQNLRMWRAPDNTRLVFDLSDSVEHRVFALENPSRLVIDLDNARFLGTLPDADPANPMLSAIRIGRPEGATLRFVLDLKVAARPRSFVLKPAGQYGHRLVVDLFDPRAEAEDAPATAEEAAPPSPPTAPATPPAAEAKPAPAPTPAPPLRKREWVIAIDAGHGGEDPGAKGRTFGTREKDVTLAIARELARLVARESDMKPVLIREGDYYVDLEHRARRAKLNQADIFVSIHADALPGRRVAYGSSVFALSEKGSSNALIRALEDQNNKSDLIGGVNLANMPTDVQKTFIDLSLEKKVEHSIMLGEDILAELGQVGRVHMRQVAQAGFMVLRSKWSVDVPSVLVETAFISTPEEERKLRDPGYQNRLATAVLKGIKRYFARNGHTAPLPAPVASANPREHVVQSGETLGAIARQYNVNLEALRFLNNLAGNDVPAGFRLRLPDQARGI